jgi:pimeloyl-ACP methyl ester carboxylesterase
MAVLLAALAACDGGNRSTVTASSANEAVIGPEGGTLVLAAPPHEGVALTVPAGAVAAPTRFSIEPVTHPAILSLFPVYRFEPTDVALAAPVQVTVRAGDALFATSSGAGIACFCQPAPGSAWLALDDSVLDAGSRLVTASALRLGDVVAWNGSLHRLFTQDRGVVDPAVPAMARTFDVPVLVANGELAVQVGRGSLASFWSSPAAANVLIVHGFLGSPIDFTEASDIAGGLPPSVANVVLLSYPSSPGVATAANALYDLILRERGPGFGCSIVGHSMGGLVARYLLERSADDPARAGHDPADEPLGATVAHLVMLGVPNAGSELGNGLSLTLLPHVPAAELPLLQAVVDLSYRPDSITMQLNAAYVDNPTRYHVVYGDLGSGSDGVVTVASATALPLFGPETSAGFAVDHDGLHRAAGANGIAAHVGALLQAP